MSPEYQRGACPVCDVKCGQRRRALRAGTVSYAVTECIECEVIYLDPATHLLDDRVRALTEKCAVLSSDHEALAEQLQRAERRLAALQPPPSDEPCQHCGEHRLSLPHLVANGHSYEASA